MEEQGTCTPRRSPRVAARRVLNHPLAVTTVSSQTRSILKKSLLGHAYELFDRISDLVKAEYSSLSATVVAAEEDDKIRDYLLICRNIKTYIAEVGPHDALRLIIDTDGNYRLLVYNQLLQEGAVTITDFSCLSQIAEKMNDKTWVICVGVQQYSTYKSSIGYDLAPVNTTDHPPNTARHKECLYAFYKKSKKSQLCEKCLSLKWRLSERKRSHDGYTTDQRLKRQRSDSPVPFCVLSPASKKARLESMQEKIFKFHVQTSHLESRVERTQIDETQNAELLEFVGSLHTSDIGQSVLRDIYHEADESGDGRGDTLKKIWESDVSDLERFKSDQLNNSKYY